jgi:hypothetical protein
MDVSTGVNFGARAVLFKDTGGKIGTCGFSGDPLGALGASRI